MSTLATTLSTHGLAGNNAMRIVSQLTGRYPRSRPTTHAISCLQSRYASTSTPPITQSFDAFRCCSVDASPIVNPVSSNSSGDYFNQPSSWPSSSSLSLVNHTSSRQPRFDWRSRSLPKKHIPKDADKKKAGQRSIKRVPPRHVNLQRGELFYEEVEAYEERCVIR